MTAPTATREALPLLAPRPGRALPVARDRQSDRQSEIDQLFDLGLHGEVARMVVLDRIVENEREIRRLEARRLALFAEAFDLAAQDSTVLSRGVDVPTEASIPTGARGDLSFRSMRAEIACALHLSETMVERRVGTAWQLVGTLPAVLDAVERGDISEQHARVIAEEAFVVGVGDDVGSKFRRAEYASRALEVAVETSPNRLRPVARRIAEQYAEIPLDERFERARERRGVWVRDVDHGMAELTAVLPAVQAYAIQSRLTRMAREITLVERAGADRACPKTPRGMDAIRADLLADLLLGAAPAAEQSRLAETLGQGSAVDLAAIRAHVQVLIPAGLLEIGSAGTDAAERLFDEIGGPTGPAPAMLHGYGPIDTESAREIAGDATAWDAIRTDPGTLQVLAVNRYRPSEQMRRLLRARDQHCRFPGCQVPLSRCDIDHTIDATRGGPTATDNLAHLCRGHHMLKHHGGCRVRQCEGGILDWASRAGRIYRERPPSTVMFRAVG